MRNAGFASVLIAAAFWLTWASPTGNGAQQAAAREDDSDDALGSIFGPKLKLSDEDLAAIDAEPLGSAGNPIRADMPGGEREYLSRLVCADGARPVFRRAGSVGRGPYGSIMDLYIVECVGLTAKIHMDMYHLGYVERRAPEGFTIDPPRGDV